MIKRLIAIAIIIFVSITSLLACMGETPVPAPQAESSAEESMPPLQPSTAPEPAPEPTLKPDEPEYSEEEICALIWNMIPSQLPGGYGKSDLAMDTRTATYEGDGRWIFSASGEVRQEGPLTTEIVKTEDYWVERESCEVTSYEIRLRAKYYEKTKILDIENVTKLGEQVTTETSDTPILREEIKLNWLNAQGTAHHYYLEGSIKNIGKIPIARLLIEFFLYDEDGNLLRTEKCKITPDPLPSGEIGKFKHDFIISGKSLHTYDCRFILETGEVFEYLKGSGKEEPVFFYEMDLEKATADIPIPRGIFSAYVMPLNKQVRNTTMSILSEAPQGIDSNAEVWKIWKIHNWVANNIEYVSDPLGFEYVAYPYETIECKAGDCDDFSVLLASMYEASGLDAMIAYVALNEDQVVDHAACLVYYPHDYESFVKEEEAMVKILKLSYPTGERYLKYLHITDKVMPYKTSDIYQQYDEGIWIVADPLATNDTDIIGYIIYEPYVILLADDVGS